MTAERELVLRLYFEGETVSGELDTADGEHRAFTGWLSLLSQLQALRLAPVPRGPARPG
jgi:hypothetical protein